MEPLTVAPFQVPSCTTVPVAPRWGKHRGIADAMARAFRGHPEAAEMLQRMAPCAQRLGLRISTGEDGQELHQVQSAHFCQQRFCPVCDWRRVVRWRARIMPGLVAFHAAYPKHRPLFLTLTVKNCRLEDTAATVQELHQAWGRLVKRSEFPTAFWMRRTELTVGRPAAGDDGCPDGPPMGGVLGWIEAASKEPAADQKQTQERVGTDAASAASQKRYVPERVALIAPDLAGRHWIHPHIHALLMVPARYFTADYIRQSRWRELWMESARLDYAPVVDVRRGYVRDASEDPTADVLSAALECSKYISKHTGMLALGPAIASLQREIRHQRMIALSRPLSQFIRSDEPLGEDLTDAPEIDWAAVAGSPLFAQWDAALGAYFLNPT